jgi:hypothetical protein
MFWYHYSAIIFLVICLATTVFHIFRLIRLGKPMDYAPPAGDIPSAIRYSFTGAMNPGKKESAYLHLPTYTAGILYHIGTFLCFLIFLLSFFGIPLQGIQGYIVSAFLAVTAGCGIGILVKRIAKHELKSLSSPDDYLSNLLVTAIQVLTVITILTPAGEPFYYTAWSILLLYLPLGKLRHMVYFFAARYQLGFFYGRRGVWPPKTL